MITHYLPSGSVNPEWIRLQRTIEQEAAKAGDIAYADALKAYALRQARTQQISEAA